MSRLLGSVQCPEPEVLAAFSRGELTADTRQAFEAHFDQCTSCAQVVADLIRIYASGPAPSHTKLDLDAAERGGTGPRGGPVEPELERAEVLRTGDELTLDGEEGRPAGAGALEPGGRLDRYHLLAVVGRGGMGTVYAAYDPVLDRKVALKVLHDSSSTTDERAQRRLVREAQAMARLSHPNVITVHEARVEGGRVFLSMEFVGGGTLSGWIAREQRTVEQILAMFRDIGQGLAAAHAAGLVHRDVKPDNVLIGADNRPRVTDFGLARPSEDLGDALALDVSALADRSTLHETITHAGALVGTPAYMAPEQLRREVATAASDQFSYCVALHQALYGSRPFAGKSLPELATNVLAGTIVEPARDPGVPRWLRLVVLRGLSVDPKDRWSSMTELVARLHPPRRRRTALVLAAAGLATAGVVLVASRTRSDLCANVDELIAARWDAATHERVSAALSSGTTTYAEDTATRVIQRLDDYAAEWTAGQRDACEDYHRGGQSSEALDLRSACLDERLRDLSALIDVLGVADDEVRRNAIIAVDGLPTLGLCDDLPALRSRLPLPKDLATRAKVLELEESRARVEALRLAGRYGVAIADADVLVASVREVGYGASLGRALLSRAQLHQRLSDHPAALADLREAWTVALGAGDESSAVDSVVQLVRVLGVSGRFEEAEYRADEARAMIDRVARHEPARADELRADLDEGLGTVALRLLEFDEADEYISRALEVVELQSGPDHLRTAKVLNSLAAARLPQARYADALALFRRVLRIRSEQLGPEHPETAAAHNSIGLTLKNMGQYTEAETELLLAQSLIAASIGTDNPAGRMIEVNLASARYGQKRFREAADAWLHAMTFEEVRDSTEFRDIARALQIAHSLGVTGRLPEAHDILDHLRVNIAKLDTVDRAALEQDLARIISLLPDAQ